MHPEILIADDDPAMLKIYSRVFSGQGYAVTFANSVTAASALIKANHYDLLITDLMFPDGKGTALITIFKRNRDRAKCILVTGSWSEVDQEQLPALAAYFEKPLNVEALLAAVTKALAPDLPQRAGGNGET